MRRFFCPPEKITEDKIYLPAETAHHIKDVLRFKKGDKIEIFDGKWNKYNCILQDLNSANIVSKEFSLSKETACMVTLAQAIPNKLSKMDFIIEKATELGVDTIAPVAAERSIINVGAIHELPLRKLQRWQKIAEQASRQCGRAKIPEVKEVISVGEALAALKNSDIKLFPCIDKTTIKLQDALGDFKCRGTARRAPTIAIFIGPEGDFSPREIKSAKDNGFKLVSLGERVLRTETAGLYILSVLDYVFG